MRRDTVRGLKGIAFFIWAIGTIIAVFVGAILAYNEGGPGGGLYLLISTILQAPISLMLFGAVDILCDVHERAVSEPEERPRKTYAELHRPNRPRPVDKQRRDAEEWDRKIRDAGE